MEKGYAYEAGGNIYFDTSQAQSSTTSSINFEEEDLAVGVREGVEEDGNKRNKSGLRPLVHQVQVRRIRN